MPSLRHDCLRKLAIHIPVQEEVLDFNARHYVGFPIGLAVVRGLAHSDVALIGACRHVSLGDGAGRAAFHADGGHIASLCPFQLHPYLGKLVPESQGDVFRLVVRCLLVCFQHLGKPVVCCLVGKGHGIFHSPRALTIKIGIPSIDR